MDWWRAIYPTLGASLFVAGMTLLGVVWEAVEAAPPSRHLTMTTPMTYVAFVMLILGAVVFWGGMTEQGWLPGVRAARKRQETRDEESNRATERRDAARRWQRQIWDPPSRDARVQEALADALREHTQELRRLHQAGAADGALVPPAVTGEDDATRAHTGPSQADPGPLA